MKEIIFGFDVDGCLRDFATGLNNVYIKQFPQYKNMVEPTATSWGWFHSYEFEGKEPQDWMIENVEKILALSPVYEGINDIFNMALDEIKKLDGAKLKIITHQMTNPAKIETTRFLYEHLERAKEVDIIFSTGMKDKWNYADIMLDDSPNLLQSKPEDKTTIKVRHEYNKDIGADFTLIKFINLTPEIIREAFKNQLANQNL